MFVSVMCVIVVQLNINILLELNFELYTFSRPFFLVLAYASAF